MSTDETNGGSYRVTTAMLGDKIDSLQRQVATMSTSIVLMDQRLNTALSERGEDKTRISKLEARMNGVLVGLGTGVAVAAVTLLRGLV
jgi:hypothetical protein